MVAAPTLQRISVEDAVTRYLRNVERAVAGHSLSPATAANYRRDLTEFIRLAGAEVILDDLDAETLDDIVLAYSSTPDGRFKDPTKTRGPGATSRFRQSMSRLFTEALAAGWIEHNPVPQMRVKPKQPPLATAARKALPATAAAALVAHRPGDDVEGRDDQRLDLRDRFLLMLFMEGGPRVSEVCRANRSDLEVRDDGSVWLTLLGKGGKVRQIPLSAATYAAWLDYEQNARPAPTARTHARADGRVIETAPVGDAEAALVLTWRGKRMTPRDIQLMVARHCRRLPASVRRDVTPHGLRHTAATLLLSSGAADVNTVREILGHASLATTGIYLDGIDDDKRRAVAAHPITSRTATS